MLTVIGHAFDNLTLSDRAEPLARRALELERAITGDESAAVIAGLQQLARVR